MTKKGLFILLTGSAEISNVKLGFLPEYGNSPVLSGSYKDAMGDKISTEYVFNGKEWTPFGRIED